MNPWLVAALGAAASIALGAAWARARRRGARLERLLERSTGDLQNLRNSFSRFVPESVIEDVIARGVRAHGEKREVTVLFSDLVGFTALSESVEPSVLVRILNGYFERMSRVIADHRGHVSKFIGDGILAFFGALDPNPWQSNDAVAAALAMRQALADYNRELAAEALPTLALGIGLHRGDGVAGLIGSHELIEFTVVGATVNIAARVQELTRQFDADILLTDAVQRHLDPRYAIQELPPTTVKGVEHPLVLFALAAQPAI